MSDNNHDEYLSEDEVFNHVPAAINMEVDTEANGNVSPNHVHHGRQDDEEDAPRRFISPPPNRGFHRYERRRVQVEAEPEPSVQDVRNMLLDTRAEIREGFDEMMVTSDNLKRLNNTVLRLTRLVEIQDQHNRGVFGSLMASVQTLINSIGNGRVETDNILMRLRGMEDILALGAGGPYGNQPPPYSSDIMENQPRGFGRTVGNLFSTGPPPYQQSTPTQQSVMAPNHDVNRSIFANRGESWRMSNQGQEQNQVSGVSPPGLQPSEQAATRFAHVNGQPFDFNRLVLPRRQQRLQADLNQSLPANGYQERRGPRLQSTEEQLLTRHLRRQGDRAGEEAHFINLRRINENLGVPEGGDRIYDYIREGSGDEDLDSPRTARDRQLPDWFNLDEEPGTSNGRGRRREFN